MAARDLELLVNVQGNALISSFTSTTQAGVPGFVFGDSTPVSVRLVTPSGSVARPWREIDLTNQTVRIGIGIPGSSPTAGTFSLTYGGSTTTALPYNATAGQISAALNLLAPIIAAGGISVTATSNAFKIIFTTAGVRTSITADTSAISPTSGAYISTVLEGAIGVQAIYLVKLEAMPASYQELTEDFPVAAILAETVRSGGVGISEIQKFSIDPAPYDGTYALSISGQETAALAYNSTSTEIQAALESLAGIGSGLVTVSGEFPDFTITFASSLGNVGTISGDVSALIVPIGRKGLLSNNTTGIAELLASRERVDAILEIEIVDDITGDTWTPLQAACVIREDVIPNAPASSTESPSYILESVANAGFLRVNAAAALNSTNRRIAFENLGFTAYADLAAANAALPIGTLFYNIAGATLAITTD